MAVRRIRAVGGLSTDPSALEQPEALRIAENVVLHRPGIIQPRPGFGDATGITARSTDYRPIEIVPYSGGTVVQSWNELAYRLEKLDSSTAFTGNATPPDDEDFCAVSSFAEARGSLYMTTNTGVMKLTSTAATALTMAGVRTSFAALSYTTSTRLTGTNRYAIAASGAAAYRYCWLSKDANGYIRRSPPSSRWVVAAGGADYENVIFGAIDLPDGIVAGDTIEIYRTENVTPATATPGEEYYLAITHVVDTTDTGFGAIQAKRIVDETPDDQLGAALYTNPSQGGALEANHVPPQSMVIAAWNGCMWYGNTTSRHAINLQLVQVFDTADEDTNRNGLHYSSKQANFVATTTGFTMATVNGLRVGQYITSTGSNTPRTAGTYIPALTKITALVTNITVNNATLVAGSSTITLWGHTLTWVAASGSDSQITIGANSIASATNLVAKINAFPYAEPLTVDSDNGGGTLNVVSITSDIALTAGSHSERYGTVVTTANGGGTVLYSGTMSAAALASSGGNVATGFHDWIDINGTEFFFGDENSGNVAADKLIDWTIGTGATQEQNISIVLREMAEAINEYQAATAGFDIIAYIDSTSWAEANPGPQSITLLREEPWNGTFTVKCSVRMQAWRPRILGTYTSDSTRAPGRLHWSKLNEPEAVRLVDYQDIGNINADILALVPLRHGLLVWKEDGLFVVTGAPPNSWSFSPLDTAIRLISPRCAIAFQDICYAWTDRGVVAATETGVSERILSAPVGLQLRELARGLELNNTDGSPGFWMAKHERLGLLIVGVSTAGPTTRTSDRQYVFSLSTQRWCTWTLAARCMAYDSHGDRGIYSHDVEEWSVRYERSDEDTPASYRDASLSGLAATYSGGGSIATIAIAAFGVHTPAIGDVVEGSGSGSGRITAVASGGGNYTLTTNSTALSGATATWSKAIAARVDWSAQQMPGRGSRWSEFHVELAQSAAYQGIANVMRVGGSTERADVYDGAQSYVEPALAHRDYSVTGSGYARTGVIRVGPPRELVRANHLYPSLRVTAAMLLWQVGGLDLHAVEPQSQRVAR